MRSSKSHCSQETELTVNHALKTNVLVQPNVPRNGLPVVDVELLTQQVVTLLVGDLGVRIDSGIRVDRTELAIPDGQAVLMLELGLAPILLEQDVFLLLRALVTASTKRCDVA